MSGQDDSYDVRVGMWFNVIVPQWYVRLIDGNAREPVEPTCDCGAVDGVTHKYACGIWDPPEMLKDCVTSTAHQTRADHDV